MIEVMQPLPLGLSIDRNSDTLRGRQDDPRGYLDKDKPLLESFGILIDDKPPADLPLKAKDYREFIDWLSNGPATPVPSAPARILCYYRRKLEKGMNNFGTTDGMRLKQRNLVAAINDKLRGGDDSKDPDVMCASGGGDSAPTSPDSGLECCDELKETLATITATLDEIAQKDSSVDLTEVLALLKEINAKAPGTGGSCDLTPVMDLLKEINAKAPGTGGSCDLTPVIDLLTEIKDKPAVDAAAIKALLDSMEARITANQKTVLGGIETDTQETLALLKTLSTKLNGAAPGSGAGLIDRAIDARARANDARQQAIVALQRLNQVAAANAEVDVLAEAADVADDARALSDKLAIEANLLFELAFPEDTGGFSGAVVGPPQPASLQAAAAGSTVVAGSGSSGSGSPGNSSGSGSSASPPSGSGNSSSGSSGSGSSGSTSPPSGSSSGSTSPPSGSGSGSPSSTSGNSSSGSTSPPTGSGSASPPSGNSGSTSPPTGSGSGSTPDPLQIRSPPPASHPGPFTPVPPPLPVFGSAATRAGQQTVGGFIQRGGAGIPDANRALISEAKSAGVELAARARAVRKMALAKARARQQGQQQQPQQGQQQQGPGQLVPGVLVPGVVVPAQPSQPQGNANVAALRTQLADKERELAELRDALRRKTTNADEALARAQRLEGEIDDLRRRSATDLGELQNQIEHSREQAAALARNLLDFVSEARRQIGALQARIAEMGPDGAAAAELRAAKDAMEARLRAATDALENADDHTSRMEASAAAFIALVHATIEAYIVQARHNREEIDRLEAALAGHGGNVVTLRARAEAAERRVQELLAEIGGGGGAIELNRLRTLLAEAEAEIEAQRREVIQKSHALAVALEDKARLERELQTKETNLETITRERDRIAQELAEAQAEIVRKDTRIADLSRQLEDLRAELGRCHEADHTQALRARIVALEAALTEETKKLKKATRMFNRAMAGRRSLSVQLGEAHAELIGVRRELEERTVALATEHDRAEAATATAAEKTAEVASLTARLDTITAQQAVLMREREAALQELAQLRAQHGVDVERVRSLESEIARLIGHKPPSDAQIEDLQRALAAATAAAEASRLAQEEAERQRAIIQQQLGAAAAAGQATAEQMARLEAQLREKTAALAALEASLVNGKGIQAAAAQALAAAEAAAASANARVTALEGELETARAAALQKDAQIADLTRRIASSEAKVARVIAIIERQRAFIQSLKEVLESGTVSYTDALAALEQLRDALADQVANDAADTQTIRSLREQIEQKEAAIAAQAADLEQLRRTLGERDTRIGLLEQAARNGEGILRGLRERIEATGLSLTEALRGKAAANASAEEARRLLDTEVSGRNARIAALGADITARDATIAALTARAVAAESRVAEAEAEAAEQRGLYQAAKAEMTTLERRLGETDRRLAQLVAEVEGRVATAEGRVAGLEAELAAARAAAAAAKGAGNQEALIHSLQDRIAVAEAAAGNELGALTARIVVLEGQRDELARSLERAEARAAQADQSAREAEAAQEGLRVEVTRLTAALAAKQAEAELALQQVAALQERLAAATANQGAEAAEVSAQLEAALAQITELKPNLIEAQAEVVRLKNQLADAIAQGGNNVAILKAKLEEVFALQAQVAATIGEIQREAQEKEAEWRRNLAAHDQRFREMSAEIASKQGTIEDLERRLAALTEQATHAQGQREQQLSAQLQGALQDLGMVQGELQQKQQEAQRLIDGARDLQVSGAALQAAQAQIQALTEALRREENECASLEGQRQKDLADLARRQQQQIQQLQGQQQQPPGQPPQQPQGQRPQWEQQLAQWRPNNINTSVPPQQQQQQQQHEQQFTGLNLTRAANTRKLSRAEQAEQAHLRHMQQGRNQLAASERGKLNSSKRGALRRGGGSKTKTNRRHKGARFFKEKKSLRPLE